MSKAPRKNIRLAELARRITGISVPGFGLQWSPPDDERKTVRTLLTFLEDRRVLYKPENLEFAGEVEQSVMAIRQRCTESMAELPERSPAVACVGMIRAACRAFLDQPRADFRNFRPTQTGIDQVGPGFFTALGELRARVGVPIAILAVRYEIEIEPELASIVPLADWEEIL